MKRAFIRAIAIMLIAAFSSAASAANTSVFDRRTPELGELVMSAPDLGPEKPAGASICAPVDSIEVMEIEIPEEKEGSIFKEVAMYTVLAAFAGYVVYTLFFSEEEEGESDDNGKDLPTSIVPLF